MVVSNRINQMYEEMKTWRQDLHRIPEIGLEEYETSQYIKSKLSEFKI
jgi:metal-dependent amidase/aminoacylase/carboxypeptidase family protein